MTAVFLMPYRQDCLMDKTILIYYRALHASRQYYTFVSNFDFQSEGNPISSRSSD